MGRSVPTMGVVEWLLLIVLATLWGGSFFFAKVAVAEVPPFTIAAARVGLAAVALVVVVRASGLALPRRLGDWVPFLVMGFLNNAVPFTLIFWGQIAIASGLASILNASMPIFTTLFAHFLTADERLSTGKVTGIALGMFGVAVMIGIDAFGGFGLSVWAQLACVGAAVSYAFASIYGRRFAATPPLVTSAGQLVASSSMLVPAALIVDRPWHLPPPGLETLASLGALALVSTALAYILYFRILKAAGATNVSLVTLLVPVSAILLGAIFLGERLTAEQFAGMALIGFGLIAIDGRPFAWLRRRVGAGRRRRDTSRAG